MSKKVIIITDKNKSFYDYETTSINSDYKLMGAVQNGDVFPHIKEIKPDCVLIEIIEEKETLFFKIAGELDNTI
jgi:hypothetical protein